MSQTLAGWLDKILAMHEQEIDMGLTRIKQVAKTLGVTQGLPPVITVAGTNGKGSTIALLNALATAKGLATGVYTSPHITHFNERIRVNNSLATDAQLCAVFEKIDQARGAIPLTFFEFTTLAALLLFKQAELDLYILEVGLGGRLDAVNIVDADVALVTSIALDHTDWLGDDLDIIAMEKAGIARPHKPLLYGMPKVPAIVREQVQQDNLRLFVQSNAFGATKTSVWWQGKEAKESVALTQPIALGEDNFAMAVQALALLDLLPAKEQLLPIASNTTLEGRSQYFYHAERHWYLDVGHNEAAVNRFFQRLPTQQGKLYGVCGMLLDKSPATLASQAERVEKWYLADLHVPRGGTAERLRTALPNHVRKECFANVAAALQQVQHDTAKGDTIVVFGSFYTVAEAEAFLHKSGEVHVGDRTTA